MTPAYCTQNDGDCRTCSLSNYGRDCMNNPIQDIRRLEEAALSYGLPLEEIALGALAAGVDLHRTREARILRPREWGPGVPPMGRPW